MTYSTGLIGLDRMLGGGIRRKQLTLISGTSQSGMTTMLDTIVRSVVFDHDIPAMLVDCETQITEHAKRLMSAITGVDLIKIQQGKLTETERSQVAGALDATREAPFGFAKERTVDGVRAALVRAEARPQVLLIDGMRFLDFDEDTNPLHDSWVLQDLKQLAMTLNVAVVVTHPLSGDAWGRQPVLADLPTGFAHIADEIVLLYRAEIDDGRSRSNTADVVVAKARAGFSGLITVAAEVHRARFATIPDLWAA